MVGACLLLVTPPAAAQQPSDSDDADPIATALAYSSTLPDGGAREVILATSETFADSLASGLLQGQRDAPLLLTPSDALDDRVVAEIERLGTEGVIILGGVAAISDEVERQVADMVTRVDRVAGDTRITTAMAVADFAYAGSDAPWPCPRGASCASVMLTRAFGTADGDQSQAFADALGAGAASAKA
jgi:putative cell wall-binding protein